MALSPALTAYRALMYAMEPLAPLILRDRAAKGKEDLARLPERLGRAGRPRPPGPLVWLHGVSVGETLSLLPLVERIQQQRPDVTVLVTSGTVTAARLMAERLKPPAIHQYAPVDGPGAVARFLDHWRPDVGVFAESELWPNLILEAKRRGVKLALVSARITEASADGWALRPAMAARLLQAFSLILPQDRASADRITALGGHVDGLVNLKLAGAPLPHDTAEFARLSALIGDRPVVVAASTHEGEEAAVVQALDAVERRLFLVLAPRHPERGPEIARALRTAGYDLAVRSAGQAPTHDTDLYLADTLGEMGLWMRLADVVVMGGSFGPALGLSPVGGHNPLEPARLGKPAISGPEFSNWEPVTRRMEQSGGLQIIDGPAALGPAVAALVADPAEARRRGEAARRAAADAGAGLDRLWDALSPMLPARAP